MEKNALAERVKNAEASKKRFDDELKRHAAETQTREEIRKSLDAEVRRLKHKVGQTEGEKKEKEDQIARCEAFIDGMESKLQVCQVCSCNFFYQITDYFIISNVPERCCELKLLNISMYCSSSKNLS
jgi:hypothetical protein